MCNLMLWFFLIGTVVANGEQLYQVGPDHIVLHFPLADAQGSRLSIHSDLDADGSILLQISGAGMVDLDPVAKTLTRVCPDMQKFGSTFALVAGRLVAWDNSGNSLFQIDRNSCESAVPWKSDLSSSLRDVRYGGSLLADESKQEFRWNDKSDFDSRSKQLLSDERIVKVPSDDLDSFPELKDLKAAAMRGKLIRLWTKTTQVAILSFGHPYDEGNIGSYRQFEKSVLRVFSERDTQKKTFWIGVASSTLSADMAKLAGSLHLFTSKAAVTEWLKEGTVKSYLPAKAQPVADAGKWPLAPRVKLGEKTFSTPQEAVDAAPDGSTIELPQGIYDAPLKIAGKKNLTVSGVGGNAYFLLPLFSEQVIAIEKSSNVKLRNVIIGSSPPPPYGTETNAILVKSSVGVVLDHVVVHGVSGYGMRGIESEALTVQDCAIQNCRHGAIALRLPRGPLTIRRTRIVGNGAGLFVDSAVNSPPVAQLIFQKNFVANSQGNFRLVPNSAFRSIAEETGENLLFKTDEDYSLLKGENQFFSDPDKMMVIVGPLATDWTWVPTAKFLSVPFAEYVARSASTVATVSDSKYNSRELSFCGKQGPAAVYARLDGAASGVTLPACDAIDGSFTWMNLQYFRVVDHREGWLQLEPIAATGRIVSAAWVKQSTVVTPFELKIDGETYPIGLMNPKLRRENGDNLVFEGARNVCGSGPTLTEEVAVKPSTKKEAHKTQILRNMKFKDTDTCGPP